MVSSIKCSVGSKTWLPWIKIERRGKLHFWLISTKANGFVAYLTWDKNVHYVKNYLPLNFKTNKTTVLLWLLTLKLKILTLSPINLVPLAYMK